MRRSFAMGLVALGALVLAGAGGHFWLANHSTGEKLGLGGSFVLEDVNGQPFPSTRLAGKPYVIFFGYTHCPDVCPATLAELTTDIKALRADAGRMRYVFVTLDPARDTPAVLKDYVGSFDSHIIGLTGTASQVAKVAKEWSVFYRIVPGSGKDYTLEHSAASYLMDAKGRFSGFFTFKDSPSTQLAKIRGVISGKSAL